jgi:predicted phosphodiesterase
MRIQLLSDLHLEFHADAGKSFIESMNPEGVDVLVLAGDISAGDAIEPSLAAFARHYPDTRILYVHGNHEFYGSTRERVVRVTRRAVRGHENLYWLDGDTLELGGHRFLGAPLWFPWTEQIPELQRHLADYARISGFESWVYAENQRAVALFERELRANDIVITHHLPANASVAPMFVGSRLNAFFLTDLEPLIREREPALWLHGHTHTSVDARVGATRIVCNPFGYVPGELNASFQDRLLLEL